MSYDIIVNDEAIDTAAKALEANGVSVTVVQDGTEAKKAVLGKLPKGAEVMTATSVTLDATGIATAINESGDYDSVRNKLNSMYGDESKKSEQRKLGAAPDYIVGSVHAVTQDGLVLVASNTGSQLPAYAYGAGTVIWVVGAQKIVKDMAEAHDRLKTHVLPLENERAHKAYGVPGSNISKMFELHKEVQPGRIHMVIVKERLGF